jgi:hypothetical protein
LVCTHCAYSGAARFEWEQSKAGINFRRHRVRMPEAIPVFEHPDAITITDDESDPCFCCYRCVPLLAQ